MTEKIFKGIFLSSIATMLSCFAFFIVVLYLRHENNVWLLLLDYLSPILLMVVIIIIASLVIALLLANRIVKPINQIDPDNPTKDNIYDELEPLLRKIRAQNKRIKREKAKLSKSREEFRLITKNMSEGLIVVDINADVLSCNAAAAEMLGNSDTETVGKSIFTLNHTKDLLTAIEGALKGENSELTLNIDEKIYQVIINAVKTDNVVSGAILIILDITEKEKREALRREFTSNVSHELKTPLTSIYGISDMLSSGLVKPEDVKGFAEDINREANRLIHLVEDIIRLSRLDEGGYSVEAEEIDLKSVAEEVIKSLETTVKNAKVELISQLESVVLKGHPTILSEIIFNLLDNAVKYNKEGGFVKLSLAKKENYAVITVEDNGIGIPSGDCDRVFERFYRVDKSRSKSKNGTGLGLSIVKHGIAYHNGKVALESAEGKGTTVTVSLPLE